MMNHFYTCFWGRFLCNTLTVFFLFFLSSTFSATYANTVIIGTGSGALSKTSMGTLQAGDTLAITAGTYSGGATFANLHDITIINY
ncbi:MAG: hypothetical protein JST58_17405, partial [Bacteroidetes bacterium]|nr:hypothetical protein [Bacteroidota bacterium]